jgi:hypothetical protein
MCHQFVFYHFVVTILEHLACLFSLIAQIYSTNCLVIISELVIMLL